MAELTLSELNVNELAEVISIQNKELELRLLSMGCIPGEKILVERRAIFGDPVLIRSGSTLLSLRKENAAEILVKKQD